MKNSKRILFVILTLGLFVTLFIGCDKKSSTGPEPINEFDLVAAVGDNYLTTYKTKSGAEVNIGIDALFDLLITDGNTANDPFIMDCRSAADFAAGRIKGAVNIPPANLMDKIADGTIPKDKKIVSVCYTGQNSSLVTSTLNMLGYDCQSLLFGMCSVTSDPTKIPASDRWATQIQTDEFADKLTATVSTLSKTYDFPTLSTGKDNAEDIIKARYSASNWTISAADVFAATANYFIINYWPEAEYLNPGHIPGAFQYTPKNDLKKDQKLKYLPTDKKIVVYCYSGQTSAQVVAYLRVLGYDAVSLLYGQNGFAYNSLTKSKYVAPTKDYSALIVK